MPKTTKKAAPNAASEKPVETSVKDSSAPVTAPAEIPAPKEEKPKKESKPKAAKKTADKPKAEKKSATAKTAKTEKSAPAAKKETAKKAEKTPAAKNIKPDEFKIQCNGDFTMEQITEKCIEAYKGNSKKQVKSISIYLKSENGGIRAYYVINGKGDGLFIDL